MQSPEIEQAMEMARRLQAAREAAEAEQGQGRRSQASSSRSRGKGGHAFLGGHGAQPDDEQVAKQLRELDPATRTMLLKMQPRVREELLQGMRSRGRRDTNSSFASIFNAFPKSMSRTSSDDPLVSADDRRGGRNPRHLQASLAFERPLVLWIGLPLLLPAAWFIYQRQALAEPGRDFAAVSNRTMPACQAILLILVVVLSGPYLRLDQRIEKRPIFAYFFDDSQSMALPAGPFNGEGELRGRPRRWAPPQATPRSAKP